MARRKKTKGQTTVIEFIFTTEPRVLSYNMLKKKDNYKVDVLLYILIWPKIFGRHLDVAWLNSGHHL
jgi:hypothetical protein